MIARALEIDMQRLPQGEATLASCIELLVAPSARGLLLPLVDASDVEVGREAVELDEDPVEFAESPPMSDVGFVEDWDLSKDFSLDRATPFPFQNFHFPLA
jgi:hypothetical protein